MAIPPLAPGVTLCHRRWTHGVGVGAGYVRWADQRRPLFYGARGATRLVAALASLGLLIGSGVAWSTYRGFVTGLHTSSALDVLGPTAPKSTGQDMNILLIGLDSRKDMNGNDLPPAVIAGLPHAVIPVMLVATTRTP